MFRLMLLIHLSQPERLCRSSNCPMELCLSARPGLRELRVSSSRSQAEAEGCPRCQSLNQDWDFCRLCVEAQARVLCRRAQARRRWLTAGHPAVCSRLPSSLVPYTLTEESRSRLTCQTRAQNFALTL